jgi:uncharacterized protein (DUF427 family)
MVLDNKFREASMQALWNDTVLADANRDDLIYIEGNWYFPPASVNKEFFKPSDRHTTCFWKGEASYYNIAVDGSMNEDAAWYYPAPMAGSVERVKKDFTNYVAFWNGVKVNE